MDYFWLFKPQIRRQKVRKNWNQITKPPLKREILTNSLIWKNMPRFTINCAKFEVILSISSLFILFFAIQCFLSLKICNNFHQNWAIISEIIIELKKYAKFYNCAKFEVVSSISSLLTLFFAIHSFFSVKICDNCHQNFSF